MALIKNIKFDIINNIDFDNFFNSFNNNKVTKYVSLSPQVIEFDDFKDVIFNYLNLKLKMNLNNKEFNDILNREKLDNDEDINKKLNLQKYLEESGYEDDLKNMLDCIGKDYDLPIDLILKFSLAFYVSCYNSMNDGDRYYKEYFFDKPFLWIIACLEKYVKGENKDKIVELFKLFGVMNVEGGLVKEVEKYSNVDDFKNKVYEFYAQNNILIVNILGKDFEIKETDFSVDEKITKKGKYSSLLSPFTEEGIDFDVISEGSKYVCVKIKTLLGAMYVGRFLLGTKCSWCFSSADLIYRGYFENYFRLNGKLFKNGKNEINRELFKEQFPDDTDYNSNINKTLKALKNPDYEFLRYETCGYVVALLNKSDVYDRWAVSVGEGFDFEYVNNSFNIEQFIKFLIKCDVSDIDSSLFRPLLSKNLRSNVSDIKIYGLNLVANINLLGRMGNFKKVKDEKLGDIYVNDKDLSIIMFDNISDERLEYLKNNYKEYFDKMEEQSKNVLYF